MKIDLPARRPRRRINLTPMIDVVLMLLVFFMMVSRFGGTQGIAVQPGVPGQGAAWVGPPRLVSLEADGLLLNGVAVSVDALPGAVAVLQTAPDDPVILRAGDGALVQALVDAMEALRGAGIGNLIVVGAE